MNKIKSIIGFTLLITLLFTGCSGLSANQAASMQTAPPNSIYKNNNIYSFIWMSDTQYYSMQYPAIFESMTNWTVSQLERLNIKYVLHTGDVVDKQEEQIQWTNAAKAMHVFHGKVPYLISAGNHDVGYENPDYTQFSKYFGPEQYQDVPYVKGLYQNGKGRYDLATFGKRDYLFLAMGWKVDAEAMQWMNQVLKAYPERTAILLVHDYMDQTGGLTENGQNLFNNVVVKNPNVKLVLCGHIHGAYHRTDQIDDTGDGVPDRTVHQLLTDYQSIENGGNGFLKILTIDDNTNEVMVETYSPYLDQYGFMGKRNYPDRDSYVFSLG